MFKFFILRVLMIYTCEWIYQLRMIISANMHTLTFYFLIATSESQLQGLPSESFWSVSLTLPNWWVSRPNHCLTSLPFATIHLAPFPPASSTLESCVEQRDRAAPTTVWGAEGAGRSVHWSPDRLRLSAITAPTILPEQRENEMEREGRDDEQSWEGA